MQNLRYRWGEYGRGIRSVLGLFPLYTGADYVQAQRARPVGLAALERLFDAHSLDVLSTPTLRIGAVPIEEAADLPLGDTWPAVFTAYWNAVGLPALTVPIGFNQERLPLGMPIAARAFGDGGVLRVGDAFQQQTDWHMLAPPAPHRTATGCASGAAAGVADG